MRGLSKSKILSGLQCEKRLWLEIHRPELAEWSAASSFALNAGYRVGETARALVPGGQLIGTPEDPAAALDETRAALARRGDLVLFEPAFRHGGVLVRADILHRRGRRHRLVEVKSSTSVKDYHYLDAAIQSWVLQGAGISLTSVVLRHIDNSFVYPGGGDYRGLFMDEDVSAAIAPLAGEVPGWVARLRKVLSGTEPEIAVGAHCRDPFECPFQEYCCRDEPEYPVSILPYGGTLAQRLREAGYCDLRQVPEGSLSKEHHLRVWHITRSGRAELDPEAAQEMARLTYPRYYLDFETIGFAVPVWQGTRPYQQLPFQWSCHVEDGPGTPRHAAFLDTSGQAPMRRFAESLLRVLGRQGPVLVYSSFERTVLRGLAERFADLAAGLNAVIDRLVDLLPLTQAYYYHPAMKGSWSLKAVLPTIAPELDYGQLAVQDGTMAQEAFAEMVDPGTDEVRRAELEQALLAYCRQDTLALVELARFLARADSA